MLKHAEIYTGEVTIKARAVEPALNPEQRSGTCAAGLTDASGPRYAAQRHEIRHDWTAGETLGLMGRDGATVPRPACRRPQRPSAAVLADRQSTRLNSRHR